MQGFKAANLFSRLSGSKHVFGLFVLLPVLAATPVFGQVSVITLAMVSYDQSLARPAAIAYNDAVANPLVSASVPRLQYQIAGLNLDHQNAISFSSDFLFENNNGSNRCNGSQSIYKKSNANGQTLSWMHVEAGYGQFCQYGSCFGSNAVELELQQPHCAYLRASFSF